jgi:Undecaprenyl-phosphate glucose phosphotransferase
VSSWVRTEASQHSDRSSAGHVTRRFRLPYHLAEPTVFVLDMIVVAGISVISGLGYNFIFFGSLSGFELNLAIGALAFANVAAVSASRGNYRVSNLINFKRQARDLSIIWTGVFLLLLGVVFSLKAGQNLSRGVTLTFFTLGLVGMLAWRGFVAQYLQHALSTGAFADQKVIVIGERGRLIDSRTFSEMRRCGYFAIRAFELSHEDLARNQTSPTLQTIAAEVIKSARDEKVAEILLLLGWEHTWTIDSIIRMLSVLPIPIHLLPDENVSRYLGRRTISVGAMWAAEVQRAPLTRIEQFLKRCFDVIGAASVLLLLSPLMLLTALLVKLDSRGSILFLQTRNGFNGRTFKIVKFRSMHVIEDGHVVRQATRADPRVTRLGRWLRRTNLDELPQLFNVLSGDMSLVGPRPHAVAHNSEYERCIANYAFRHHVRPGITGWAQVNGFRGETPTTDLMARRVELDLWYINNWSLWLDIKILLRTLILGLQPTGY